ncbi:MAG: AAA family ATPase [Planctomycetota bacterium]
MNDTPPYAPEAECAVLGSMILDSTCCPLVADILRNAADFMHEKHRVVYRSIMDVYRDTRAVDMVQLTQRVADLGQLNTVGGVDYLIELFESVPSAINVGHYARLVRDKADQRFFLDTLDSCRARICSGAEWRGVLSQIEADIKIVKEDADPARRRLLRADEIEVVPPKWLVPNLLEREALAGLFGPSYCGKSFVAVDWACRISSGDTWDRKPIEAGTVAYAAAEGRGGLSRRIEAWHKAQGVSREGKPLYVYPGIRMDDPASVREFSREVEVQSIKPDLIVVDTLNRSMIGDENSATDMGRFIQSCDDLRHQYGCTVLVVHHTGKGNQNQARGSSAFRAAMDAEYQIRVDGDGRDADRTLRATKMKDAPEPADVPFHLRSAVIDDKVESAVVEWPLLHTHPI